MNEDGPPLPLGYYLTNFETVLREVRVARVKWV